MRVFFLSEKRIVLGLVLGLGLLAGWWLYYGTQQVTSVVAPAEAVYRGQPERRAVALTFNVDWGEEYLPRLLQVLAAHEVRATFFPTGRWAEKFPQLLQEIAAGGHEIGNHGYSHPHINNLSRQENIAEIERAAQAIMAVTGQEPVLFAPPYGECSQEVVAAARQAGYVTVMWTVDAVDWQEGRTAADIIRKIDERVVNGAIILMHPTAVTGEALPQVIQDLTNDGYSFQTVSQIIAP